MDNLLDPNAAPQWQHHADNLFQHFLNARGTCLLWVNPAQWDPFLQSKFVQQRRVRVRIIHPRFNAELGPYIVPLQLNDEHNIDIFRESIKIAWSAWSEEALCSRAGQPVAGWIETEDDPRLLAHYWATRCHLHRFDGKSWLLRFHDPGVREWLWETLTEEQKLTIHGSARTIFGFARSRHLMRHQITSNGVPRSLQTQHFLLDQRQWNEVRNYSTMHCAWLEWIALPNAFRKPTAERWQREVLSALSHAAAYGIVDEQDRQLFALHALMIGGEFHRSPKLGAVWKKTLAGEFYGNALEDVFDGPPHQLHIHLSSF